MKAITVLCVEEYRGQFPKGEPMRVTLEWVTERGLEKVLVPSGRCQVRVFDLYAPIEVEVLSR